MIQEKRATREAKLLVSDLEQQLDQLKKACIEESQADLFPQIKRLQRRVEKLCTRTRAWEQKRIDARDSFKRIRDRAALGYKKKQLRDMIIDLRKQLSQTVERRVLKQLRDDLAASQEQVRYLENQLGTVLEQVKQLQGEKAPPWAFDINYDIFRNKKKQTRCAI